MLMFWEMLWSEMMAHIWTELFELSLQGGLELTSDCWGEPTSVHTGMLGGQCGSHGAVAFLLLSSGFPHLPKPGRYVGAYLPKVGADQCLQSPFQGTVLVSHPQLCQSSSLVSFALIARKPYATPHCHPSPLVAHAQPFGH